MVYASGYPALVKSDTKSAVEAFLGFYSGIKKETAENPDYYKSIKDSLIGILNKRLDILAYSLSDQMIKEAINEEEK